MRLIDGDQLEQRLLDEAARIMAEDLYGKDRQRMARGLQKAAEICRAAEVIVKSGHWMPTMRDNTQTTALTAEQEWTEGKNDG